MSSPGWVPCATRSTAVYLKSISTCATEGMAVAPRTVTHLLERYDELLTLSLTDTARRSALPKPKAGSSWPWMASNRTSAMRCCGSFGTASPGKSSSPVVCCPRPNRPRRTAPDRASKLAGAYCRHCVGRPTVHPRCRRGGVPRGATPTVSLPLSSRGGEAHLRCRPPCQERTQEACPRGTPHRTAPRRTERS